jgi:tetratricopeptide (TPR) repeat protein
MEWKCSCKTANDENLQKCSNCGRAKPKYFGIKVNFTPNEAIDNKKLSVFHLMVGLKYLANAKERLDKFEKAKNEYRAQGKMPENVALYWDGQKFTFFNECINCLKMLDEAEKLDEKPGFINEEEINITSISIRSDCFFYLGNMYFESNNYIEAVNNFQKSFDLDPNQYSIYKLALSTINLPVEGKSVFNSKKTTEAVENKKHLEIDLLKQAIKFSPLSNLGLLSAQILKDRYEYIISLADLS